MNEIRSEEIYEALFDDEALARLPALLAAAVDAKSVGIQWRHAASGAEVIGFCGVNPDVMQAYGEHWAAFDPWVIAGTTPARLNTLFLMDRAVPPSVFEKSAFWNEYLRPEAEDTYYCLGGGFSTPWGEGIIGLHRARSQKPFEEADLERLLPHARAIGHVLKVRVEISAARADVALARSALDALALGVITVDAAGAVVSANQAAESVLRRADGLVLRAGRVAAADGAARVALELAIGRATAAVDPRPDSLAVDRGPGEPPYLLTVTPLLGSDVGSRAAIVFRDPDAEDASLDDRLRTLFALSKAEAAIAADLSRGLPPAEISVRRGVRANTLKAQLRSIMAKLGCSRQAEVAAIIAALPPLRGD